MSGALSVKTMDYGVHSGTYSGMVPDAFAIAQALVARVHDPITGEVKIDEFKTEVPEIRRQQLIEASDVLGDLVWNHSPLLPGVTTKKADNADIILNMTWQPALTIIGMEGLPNIANAANDAYIKVSGDVTGTDSYGLVATNLVNWYIDVMVMPYVDQREESGFDPLDKDYINGILGNG